eukprot:3467255-Prymnesium_polylepis.3
MSLLCAYADAVQGRTWTWTCGTDCPASRPSCTPSSHHDAPVVASTIRWTSRAARHLPYRQHNSRTNTIDLRTQSSSLV